MSAAPRIGPIEGGASLMLAWRIAGQPALVVGGGEVAAGRVRLLLAADAQVTVVSPNLNAELQGRHRAGELGWHPRTFEPQDVQGAALVMTAVDDPAVYGAVGEAAKALNIPHNAADVPDACDFWFPSVHREGPVQIAVSTQGNGPALAARLRREIAAALPEQLGQAVARFGRLRQAVRAASHRAPGLSAAPTRMRWLTALSRKAPWADLARLDDAGVAALAARFQRGEPPPEAVTPTPVASAVGTVHLVGAGPGDPALLTQGARDALGRADLVIADRLVPPALLALATGAVRIARKLPGRAAAAQAEIEAWMVEAALAGREVVRLKAGDPFVFGRGGEEIAVLADHGIPWRVVLGVSAALAAPALAGVPTTLRGVADRLTVITGHGQGGEQPTLPAWDPQATLVVLMGVGRAASLSQALRLKGFPADLPVAVVERASWPDQRVTHATLATLAPTLSARGVRAPAVMVIGRVVAHAATAQPAPRAAGGIA